MLYKKLLLAAAVFLSPIVVYAKTIDLQINNQTTYGLSLRFNSNCVPSPEFKIAPNKNKKYSATTLRVLCGVKEKVCIISTHVNNNCSGLTVGGVGMNLRTNEYYSFGSEQARIISEAHRENDTVVMTLVEKK